MRSFLILGVALVSSCSFFAGEKEEAKKEPTRPSLVGRVASIPSGADFVLIESYGPWRVPEGGLLSSVGTEGRTANLVATGEQLGQHVAADIRSGLAKVGDSVYYRPIEDREENPASVESPVSGESPSKLETQKAPPGEPAKP